MMVDAGINPTRLSRRPGWRGRQPYNLSSHHSGWRRHQPDVLTIPTIPPI